MQSLRLVGRSEDGAAVLLESLDGAERFSLPLDERLRDVCGNKPPTAEPEHPAQQALTPRDIQTRVRAGESAQDVADAAGVPLEKVMRFAYPVLAERSRVVDEARRARARRGGTETSAGDFGDLIDARLSEHAVNPAAVGWDAYRREDGGWTVVAAFAAGEQNRTAKFSFALHTRSVSALDSLSADLLSDRPVRALLPPDPDPVPQLDEPGPPKLAAVPDQPERPEPIGTEPELPGSTSAFRPLRRQKAHTRPIPVSDDDELFDQEALNPSTSSGSGPSWQELPLELELGDQAAPPADEHEPDEGAKHKRGRRGEKPRMPSWDDILLGVRHKSD
jgi:hypothetical protein